MCPRCYSTHVVEIGNRWYVCMACGHVWLIEVLV